MRKKSKPLKFADGGKVVKDHMIPQPKAPMVPSRASPGLKGAVKDFSRAVGEAIAPKQLTKRKSRIDKAIEEAGG